VQIFPFLGGYILIKYKWLYQDLDCMEIGKIKRDILPYTRPFRTLIDGFSVSSFLIFFEQLA